MSSATITWQSVRFDLPDPDTTVLVHHPDWHDELIMTGYFDGLHWRWRDDCKFKPQPLWWAELPEVPTP